MTSDFYLILKKVFLRAVKNKISFILILHFILLAHNTFAQTKFVSKSSVLNDGAWHKIAILEEGVYKLDYRALSEM